MMSRRTIGIAIRQLQINRGRSVFAIIALSVGITAVISMFAVGNGARKQALDDLEQMGTNLITINAGKVRNVMQRKDSSDKVTTLSMKDTEIIRERCAMVKDVVPSLSGSVKLKYGNIATVYMVNGVTAAYFDIRNFQLSHGGFFTDEDDRFGRRVAVLGSEVCANLFGKANPLGKTILLGKAPYTVIGSLRSKGANAEGGNLDAQVLIPVNTAMRRYFNMDYLNRIFVEVNDRSQMKRAEEEITAILRDHHKLEVRGKADDFTIDNQLTAIEASESSSRSFTRLITGVSFIALLTGGTGILAVMLLSVRVRTGEIGLRMSVGANRTDIVLQFMTESAILGFSGGLIGIFLGLMISAILSFTGTWHIIISPISILLSLLFSLFTGIIFGVLPANKAASVNLITALEKE
jgi:putative ABC transport system permease protein